MINRKVPFVLAALLALTIGMVIVPEAPLKPIEAQAASIAKVSASQPTEYTWTGSAGSGSITPALHSDELVSGKVPANDLLVLRVSSFGGGNANWSTSLCSVRTGPVPGCWWYFGTGYQTGSDLVEAEVWFMVTVGNDAVATVTNSSATAMVASVEEFSGVALDNPPQVSVVGQGQSNGYSSVQIVPGAWCGMSPSTAPLETSCSGATGVNPASSGGITVTALTEYDATAAAVTETKSGSFTQGSWYGSNTKLHGGGDYHLNPSTSSIDSETPTFNVSKIEIGITVFFAGSGSATKGFIRGLLNRNGANFPSCSTSCGANGANAIRCAMAGYVVQGNDRLANGVGWNELLTSFGGTITSNNPIDTAIKELNDPTTGWNTNLATNCPAGGIKQVLKVRVMAGIDTPAYAAGTTFPCRDIDQNGEAGNCPQFWKSAFNTDWQDLMTRLASKYDTAPEIGEIVASRNATIYDEPYLRQVNDAPESAGGLACTYDSGSGGTVTLGSTTIQDTSKSWATNQWANYVATAGSATWPVTYDFTVTSNTSNTLTGTWSPSEPSGLAAYSIGPPSTVCGLRLNMTTANGGSCSSQCWSASSDVAATIADAEWIPTVWKLTPVGSTFNPYDQVLAPDTGGPDSDDHSICLDSSDSGCASPTDTAEAIQQIRNYSASQSIENNSLSGSLSVEDQEMYNGSVGTGDNFVTAGIPLAYQTATDTSSHFSSTGTGTLCQVIENAESTASGGYFALHVELPSGFSADDAHPGYSTLTLAQVIALNNFTSVTCP